jgi:hypothetical protein
MKSVSQVRRIKQTTRDVLVPIVVPRRQARGVRDGNRIIIGDDKCARADSRAETTNLWQSLYQCSWLRSSMEE